MVILTYSITGWGQFAIHGDLYVSSRNELHIAFEDTYFNGGQIITAKDMDTEGIVSFGVKSEWHQLEENSFIDGWVRTYHKGWFTFPVGEGLIFSLISLNLLQVDDFVQVKYQRIPPYTLADTSSRYKTPQLHYWSWKTDGEVDLNPLLDNSDSQNISLSLTNSSSLKLEISNGNFITLTTSGNVSFSETGTNTVLLKMTQSPFTKEHHIISNKEHNWETDDFVFGSPHLDNDPASLSDNKRMFFDKSKAAFRAGIAQSDQWDDANRGTYSVAMGRNTIASGYHAVAMGLSTQSNAWYSTAMGQGTIAQSRSETVLGSYNTTYSPSGGTRDWDSSDRLFVIGNGTGSSLVSRTDALIVFKNGDALANGNWTGNVFNKLSDKRLKTKIKPLEIDHKKFMSLSPKQFEYKNIPSTIYYGFLAQNVEKIYPELVHEVPGSDSLKSIDYLGLIPILVEALKTQQHEINELKKQLNKR